MDIKEDEIKSMLAGEEMDSLIAEKVMGWHLIPAEDIIEDGETKHWAQMWLDKNNRIMHNSFSPSSDMNDAWEVAEKLRQSQVYPIEIRGDEWYDGGAWLVSIYDPTGDKILYFAKDETSGPNRDYPSASLAICRAALLAIGKQHG